MKFSRVFNMRNSDQLIKDYAVFVISKSTCPFCHTAKKVLGKYDIPGEKMKIIDIDGDKDCFEIQSYMQQITGGRTVPRVFIQGTKGNLRYLCYIVVFGTQPRILG